jgi:outer membrane immunogenic protein
MKNVLVVAAIAATIPVCALAQAAAPNTSDATTWTGFYAGVNAGGAIGSSNAQTATVYTSTGYFQPTSVPVVNTTGNQNFNPVGGSGGAQFGYNWQIAPHWILGAEADFGALEASASASGTTVYPCCSPTYFTITQTVSTDWMATVRPRIGYTTGKRGLLFISGGAAETLLHYLSHFTDDNSAANELANASVLKTGWIAGAGWEYALNKRWSARAEYLYADFGSVSNVGSVFTYGAPSTPVPATVFTHTATLTSNIFRIAADYRF